MATETGRLRPEELFILIVPPTILARCNRVTCELVKCVDPEAVVLGPEVLVHDRDHLLALIATNDAAPTLRRARDILAQIVEIRVAVRNLCGHAM